MAAILGARHTGRGWAGGFDVVVVTAARDAALLARDQVVD
jgi:hypothetical protein